MVREITASPPVPGSQPTAGGSGPAGRPPLGPGSAGASPVRRHRSLRWLWRNSFVAVCALILLILVVVALLAPYLSPFDPAITQPKLRFLEPSLSHLMGTDSFGRDIFSRVIWGTRFTLAVGTVSVLIAAVLGTAMGVAAGYLRGVYDGVLVAVVDILLCFPIILLAILLVAFFGQTTFNVMLAIGIALMPKFARIARAATLSVRELNFVEAARALGISGFKICLRHILPNIMSPLLVAMSLNIAVAILMESSLSYLGVGPPTSVITWGQITNEGRNVLRDAPWISLFPGGAITVTILAFNVLGDYVRDQLDPNFRDRA